VIYNHDRDIHLHGFVCTAVDDRADLMVVGLTPIGRATVRLLHMNAADRLKVRAVLQERGELEI
jgi:hypothetical protein